MPRQSFFEMLSGYTKSGIKEDEKNFISHIVTGSFAGRFNNRPMKLFFDFTAGLKSLLAFTSIRCYGLFLLGFGLVTLIVHFIKDYFGIGNGASFAVLIAAVVSAMIGILAVVSDKPFAIALQDFAPTDFIFFEFFCIKRVHRRSDGVGIPTFLGLIIGAMLASLTWFIPGKWLYLVTVCVCYAYVVMLSPEFSLFSTFLIMPYLSLLDRHDVILSVFVILNVISFARKVVLGRRVWYIEQYDVCLFVFLLFVLISGIFVKGIESFTNSLVMIALAMGYILSGCIIANRRLADCLINALIISSVPVSLLAAIQLVLFVTDNPISEFTGVSATFSSPSVLAVFLLTTMIFSLYFVKARRSRGAKLLYSLISLLTLSALVMTADLWAILIGIISLLCYLFSRHTRLFLVSSAALAMLISAVSLLPRSIVDRLANIKLFAPLGIDAFAERWQIARSMLFSNLFAGIGIGADCFLAELAKMGITSAEYTDGGSFILEIAVEAGIFAAAALVLLFFIRARHRMVYVSYVKHSQLSILSKFTTIATTAFIALGAFNYLWSDMTMYFLFFCVFGVGSATLRISKQEHDDRVGYYSDGRSADASSIDINLS